ncbi:FMN-binding domain-containing protein [Micromonospora matsumotoense]|uniref:FMN-binding domain-containing protein n=1 Tax=Micromonospora matsumotoense TaxID=121616 RepID=A0A1C4UIK3_9ACTN|nr:FMN-binding protein [Micromonospora matsumotoense]SCE71451.1 FMN-binding domain-containing protein [Micromonospora matsumotoense]
MRRALLAITGLAAGTTALVVLKGAPGASQVAQELPAGVPVGTPGRTDPAAPGVASERAAAPTRPAGRPDATASRTPGAGRTTTGGGTGTRSTPAAPRTSTAAPKSTNRKITGPVVVTEFGNVQVQITVSGSRIVNAVALELPQGGQSDLRSNRVDDAYSGTSGTVVRQQDANLDTVSQATATSNGYRQSLQAALDQVR